jgi:hypothetical protein
MKNFFADPGVNLIALLVHRSAVPVDSDFFLDIVFH